MSICVYLWIIFLSSCTSTPSDLRTLVPAETLIYLETNDLAAAIQPILDTNAFKQAAKTTPDLSALKGVQMAVAVTGFETSEERLTDENSVGRVQPRFVAVADTHAWNYQAVAFSEQKLGGFVADIYGSEPTVEKSEKLGGTYFIWTAPANEGGGRKAFALVIGGIIYFGNDATAIEKCVAVKKGEADSIAKAGKVPSSVPGSLASGYVSNNGVAQIAALAGLSFATQASDDEEVQSAVAGILPSLLRNSITEISWTTTKTDRGIEDRYLVAMPPDIANVFTETLAPAAEIDSSLLDVIPAKVSNITLYNFKNPRTAWRSLLITAQQKSDPLSGKVIAVLSDLLFEPYGIGRAEMFLSSVGTTIITVNSDGDGENAAFVAKVLDQKTAEAAVSDEAKPLVTMVNGERLKQWEGEGGQLKIAFVGGIVISGENTSVDDCLIERDRKLNPINPLFLASMNAAIKTMGEDSVETSNLVEMLSEIKFNDPTAKSIYFTETKFTKSGMERRTVSQFGLIGSIIAQLGSSN